MRSRRDEIVERQGEWTSHNIRLDQDTYTRGPGPGGDELKLQRAVQTIADAAGRPFDELRIVDLGCLEGLYAIEFALRGAQVLGIEGREASLVKARFAAEVLGLDNVRFVQDDVRNLSEERHGRFDVVFCWGLLYHLDAGDLPRFVRAMASVCDGFALIDTHIGLTEHERRFHGEAGFWIDYDTALSPVHDRELDGHTYRGRSYVEHLPGSTPEERERSLWASLDNDHSFWPTTPSLFNLLMRCGFTSVHEVHVPVEAGKPPDRVTLLAFAGTPCTDLLSTPAREGQPAPEAPEASEPAPAPQARRSAGRRILGAVRRRSMFSSR